MLNLEASFQLQHFHLLYHVDKIASASYFNVYLTNKTHFLTLIYFAQFLGFGDL